MITSKLDSDFISQAVEEDAWKELSGELAWSGQMLEKYQDKVDWEEVSDNSNIVWTVPMLEKFKNRLDWKCLSRRGDSYLYTAENLERFKNYWDWEELSNNSSVPYSYELIDKFIDYWNWGELINCYGINKEFYSEDFLKHYEAYIPASRLQDTKLWDAMVDRCRKKIVSSITGSCE